MVSKFQMCCELFKILRLSLSQNEYQVIQAFYPIDEQGRLSVDALAKKTGRTRKQLQEHAEHLLRQVGTQPGPWAILERYNDNNDNNHNPAVAVSWQSQLKRAKIARGEMAYDE